MGEWNPFFICNNITTMYCIIYTELGIIYVLHNTEIQHISNIQHKCVCIRMREQGTLYKRLQV